MDNREKRQAADAYKRALEEKDRKLLETFPEDVRNYIEGKDFSYTKRNVDGLPDSFGLRLRRALEQGKKPSVFFQENRELFKDYLAAELWDYFCRSIDTITEWQAHWNYSFRRSYRSGSDYCLCISRIATILKEYRQLTNYGYSVEQLLKQEISEEVQAFFENNWRSPVCCYVIAAMLDAENETISALLEELFYGEEGRIQVELIRGMVMSHNAKAFEILGKTLVAAKLSEGIRQAICENMDYGTAEAFLYLLKVIQDNNFIRFSSVKRAICCYTGIISVDSKEIERITGKELILIAEALESKERREELLKGEDVMQIYTALWAIGFYDIRKALDRAQALVSEGSRHQQLTAALFMAGCDVSYASESYAKAFVRRYREDHQLLAIMFDRFMPNVTQRFHNVLYPGNRGRYYQKDGLKKRVYTDFRDFFDTKEECLEFHDILYGILNSIPKKELKFSALVFPWNEERITKSQIILRIIFCASALQDEALICKAAGLIGDIVADYGKVNAMELLLREPDSQVLLDTLTREVADSETYTRNSAYELLNQELKADRTALPAEIASPAGRLPERCYAILEDMLRFKREDIRDHVIQLLLTRERAELFKMIERLFKDGKEEKITAGLDIILQLKKKGEEITEAADALSLIEKPTTKEKILIEEILGKASEEEAQAALFYDPSAEYEPVAEEEYLQEAMDAFYCLFPSSKIREEGIFKGIKNLLKGEKPAKDNSVELLMALDAYFATFKDTEYQGFNGTELFRNRLSAEYKDGKRGELAGHEKWDAFREEKEISEEQLFAMLLKHAASYYDEGVSGFVTGISPLLDKLFGKEFRNMGKLSLKYPAQIREILNYLLGKTEIDKKKPYYAAAVEYYLTNTKEALEYEYKAEQIKNEWRRRNADKSKSFQESVLNHPAIRMMVDGIRKDDRNYPIHYAFWKKALEKQLESGSYSCYVHDGIDTEVFRAPSVVDHVAAAANGYISTDFMYCQLLAEGHLDATMKMISSVIRFLREADRSISGRQRVYVKQAIRDRQVVRVLLKRPIGEEGLGELTAQEKKKLDLAKDCYEKISTLALNAELVRGDLPTAYSGCIRGLGRVYGVEYLVRILSALGKDTLDRSVYYYYYNNQKMSKKESLSHLLAVCIPEPEDTDAKALAGRLKDLLKGTDIREERLIETALYSPEWIPVISEYLGWEGFLSGCYYFMAHMNEKFDEKRAAVIARYTPLTEEELNAGAFALDWFQEVYEVLGEKRFEAIYKAAKYISDGARHTRARKYADAVRGKLDAAKTAEEIGLKRNKDLLMAYALIPCKEGEDKERYIFIQKYLKESKQFGAQRRASEKAASEMAVKNLAKTCGYDDETRFVLKMERAISTGLSDFLKPHEVGEYKVWLEAEESGKISLKLEKGGKTVKSVPAALKKDEYILDITEAKKTFTEQYRRTRQMLEEAMESGSAYLVSEILDMSTDPVVGGIVNGLLFKSGDFYGFPEDIRAAGLEDSAELLVAHPWHLYTDGVWHKYQELCFSRQIRQPFKQIFRELYVKTEEEKAAEHSLRYAGNQINPKMTVGVLRGRRWVADEDGLQKVYYRENIIATIYALADWFSPGDIEAPTLEWVEFYDRKSFKPLRISEVPELIFSEVMRDVDLAVSVAHAGAIDPEMSHSTIEMRRAIAEFVIPMFKLKNVSFADSHALIKGSRGSYSIHLGSGVIHQEGGTMINVLPVHSQHRGRIFLPFVDDDPKTAEVITKILFFAEDGKIKDPFILDQIVK